ncbi:hypothetical protein [Neobacillus niacini]|uniref:hypothetical protein n=1 Tax=Neobacillus niacini TaxID=86668 RepID=UPI003982E2DB
MVEILLWIVTIGITIACYFALSAFYKEFANRNNEEDKYLGIKLIGRMIFPDNPILAKLYLAGILILIALLITFFRYVF